MGAHFQLGLALADDDARAEWELRTALETYERTSQPVARAVACGALADVLDRRGEPAAALEVYRDAVAGLEPLL